MSGLEVAGLVFGVLPILVEAVKAYSTALDSFHTFRHYSEEVKLIARRMRVCNGVFLNECRLLLRLVEDEKGAENMLEDEADQRWTSKELNDRLNVVLKDSFQLCCDIVEETKDTVGGMKEEMKKFDVLFERKQSGESIRSTIKRLRGAIKIVFDKSKYEKSLVSLRDRNGDLSALRSQIGTFQQQNTSTTGTSVRHKPLPARFQSIQNSSLKLHEALCSAWCCDDSAHRGHYAKLCLEAEVQTEVRLDLAISCHGATIDNRLPCEPPIWLYVQSMSMAKKDCTEKTSKVITDFKQSLPMEISTPSSSNHLKKKASSDLTQSTTTKKKTKRVHFGNIANIPGLPTQVIVTAVAQPKTFEFDLCQAKNLCSYIKHNYRTCDSSITRNCVGYLETPQMYKHMFYVQEKRVADKATPNTVDDTTVYTISDIMRHEPDDVLEVEDQLKLAHKTALAILQFNDTPWLSERWRLGDVSYYGNRQTFDQAALKTLHLTSQISSPGLPNTVLMDGVESTEHTVSDQVRFGINNTTLFFLGIALLEISHWKPLEQKMTPRDLDNEVFAARRLASGRAPLGPEYQRIAEKCLQCNFGFGTKLNNKKLQEAVYNDVVCELEGMIERLAL
ncbi:hypothetical protein P153DRAFT_355895 [Dothidotthia symphoricarpi CBS 119687]|uniref:DUF7580 domain-containing protein n=1 Tax=Dothidotthia symphoricarpi CBS 119687 TaxID=1392245 RepID=A0A6A6AJ41_9PLEO|nr:uncharacterized protein P153DRAFT_355895 [Dothidotthia symphoricarpi CBS 119687]KAF2131118.1 hypothetical protein P153DRAFT_355895 [Dothidotthia symphoricarpi CBS 119687]